MRRMSDQTPNPVFVPAQPPASQEGSNSLGLAGFITSLVGAVLTAGFLCPIGLVLSLAALRRQPRGFAIAGVVIGLLGSCGGCLGLLIGVPLLAGGALLLATLGFIAGGGVPAINTIDHMLQVRSAIEQYEREHGALPASLGDLKMPKDMLDDGWGTPLQFQTAQQGSVVTWTLQSAGPDRQLDASDLTFSGTSTTAPQQAPASTP